MQNIKQLEYEEIRARAIADPIFFCNLVMPGQMLGSIHVELIHWLVREGAQRHQLVLMPRDHRKSFIAMLIAVWEITRNPAIRILYISSTALLAKKQLKMIKDILTSDIYRFYWPEMVNVDEDKREKWTETEIAVDHPKRKLEYIRDPTVIAVGISTTITGLHFDFIVLDDGVVRENAYTEEGREKVRMQYSLLASVGGAKSRKLVVGTRYFPKDLYNDLMGMVIKLLGDDGQTLNTVHLYEKFERQVESRGDGTGEFLWPRQRRYDGIEFGFDRDILAEKKAEYLDVGMFRAQYYNNPNDLEAGGINPECFQYYDRSFLENRMGNWYLGGRRLLLTASIDFAYSMKTAADYTSIVVIGSDSDHNHYVLDIDRFKTNKISEYYSHLLSLYRKWEFRKLIAEATAAQVAIVETIKNDYIYKDGLSLSIEHFSPSRALGSKEERIDTVLEPRYSNRQMWHYKGGNCQILEDELIQRYPPHDDVKDSLATAVQFAKPPSNIGQKMNKLKQDLMYHARFGGYA